MCLNVISPILRVRIRNKRVDSIEEEISAYDEKERQYIQALVSLVIDKKPGLLLSCIKEMEEGDEKSEAYYLLGLHYISHDDMRSFTRFKRDLGDRSKLPYERALYSILKAREERGKKQFEIALSFLAEAEKILFESKNPSKIEIFGQLKFEEGLNHMRLTQYQDAIQAFERGLEVLKDMEVPLLRGRILSAIGDLQETLENYSQAATYYGHALEELELCTDNLPAIYVKIKIVQLMEEFENFTEAESILIDILAQASGHPDIEAFAHTTLGSIYSSTERYTEALDEYTKAREIQNQLENLGEVAMIDNSIGNLFLSMEKFDDAIEAYEKSLEYWDEAEDIGYKASIEVNLGKVYFESADLEKAIMYFEKSIDSQKKLDMTFSIMNSYSNLASICLEFGEVSRAKLYLEEAVKIGIEMKDDRVQAEIYTSMAVIAILENDIGLLEQYLVQARDFGYSSGELSLMLDTSINLGIFYFHTEQRKLAENIMWQALDYSKNAGDNFSSFESLEYLRRLNFICNKRRLKILEELHDIEGILGYRSVDWEIVLDLVITTYAIHGRDKALGLLKKVNDKYIADLMEREPFFRKLCFSLYENEPDEIFLQIIEILQDGLENELILQNQSIRISQFILHIYNIYQDKLTDVLFQPLHKLVINAGNKQIREIEISAKFILNILSGSIISDVDNLDKDNWLQLLTDPLTWNYDVNEEIEEVFKSIPNISIMQYSLSIGKIIRDDILYLTTNSGILLDYHIKQLIDAEYLEEVDNEVIITEIGKIKFSKFTATLKGKLLTRITA